MHDELEILRRRTDRFVAHLERLHDVLGALATALRADQVAEVVVDAGTAALGGQSGALWRLEGGRLVLVRARNYPSAALELVRVLPLEVGRPIADAVLERRPVWLTSLAAYRAEYADSVERIGELQRFYEDHATAALPVALEDNVLGVLAITFAEPRGFDDDERRFLLLLASQCAHALERAQLHEAALGAHARAAFLARASDVLGTSIDYEQTLRNVAAFAVPEMATWCGVELLDDHGELRQVAVAHVDPAMVAYAREFRERYPPDPTGTAGIMRVVRTRQSELYPQITDDMLVAGARDPGHLEMIRVLAVRSLVIVPIIEGERVLGAITFVRSDAARPFTHDDVRMAEQLAGRAGAAIANARLYDEAVTAVRLRDEFLLVAGHELRTPLQAMSLHHEALGRLADGTPLEKVRARARKLVGQSGRLGKLIEELLDVSKISAGRLTLDRREVDLRDVVHDTVERVRDEASRAGCELVLGLASVCGRWDRSRLDQVITNLLTNAFKYGQGRPVEVRLHAEGDVAVLIVVDHGIGIPSVDHGRIFERFERAVSPRNFGGLGLGLWIVQRLVDAHGGTVGVASALGAGSTFTVRLPTR